MSEIGPEKDEHQSIEKILQSSLGEKFVKLTEDKSLLAIGFSANNVKEYGVELTGGNKINIFAKFFRHGGNLEARQKRLKRELDCAKRISDISPDSTYRIVGYDEENCILLSRTIDGCIPLSVFLTKSPDDVKTNLFKSAVFLLNLLHRNGIVHKDTQLRNFGVVVGETLKESKKGSPEGIKVFDFEDAVFEEEVSSGQFQRMMSEDIIQLFISGLLIGGAKDQETIDQNKQLKQYYYDKKEEFVQFLEMLYNPEFAAGTWIKLSKRLESEIYD